MRTGPCDGKGFSLAEVLVVVLCLGLLLGPLLAYMARMPEFNHQLGEQNRLQAQQSFQDQALLHGIDPSRAPALLYAENPSIPKVTVTTPARGAAGVAGGAALLRSLKVASAGTRPGGAGWEISAGAASPAVVPPEFPLAPRSMKPPLVQPADGSVISLSTLAAGFSGNPSTLTVRASSAEASRVVLQLDQPLVLGTGIDAVERIVNAPELAQGARGSAWAEYPGNPAAGDSPRVLSDGRTVWTTTDAKGQAVEVFPSETVTFRYVLDLGAPVLRQAGVEWVAGSGVPVDWALWQAVRGGALVFRLDWPSATKAAFGTQGALLGLGFEWTFGGAGGPFDGSFAPFFTEASLGLWGELNQVAAKPLVAAGCVASTAVWTLQRVAQELPVPELLASTTESLGVYEAGTFSFAVPPALAGGERLGRLSARGGTVLSSGPTMDLGVEP